MLTLVSERYLQLLRHPIPLCRVPMLRRHHPLHASSTPLLASSGCVDASVTAPVCPRLNVSLFFLLFCLCSLLLRCPFVPRPLPHAVSPPSCRVCSLVLRPFSHAASSPPPALHQPPFPWPIPAASTSRPLRAVSDALVIVDTPPLHAVLCTPCSARVVPPPPPTPLPRLMRASVRVPVRLCTCYFTCIRIRLY